MILNTLPPLASNDLLCASGVLSNLQYRIEFPLKINQLVRRAVEDINAFLLPSISIEIVEAYA